MKTVKLFFSGFWGNFSFERNMFITILSKRYNVVLDSQNPDFLICSPLGVPYEYMKYDCPRIMYTGEYISPDFTAIDYFIGFDDIQFGDRCFRLPLFLYSNLAKPIQRERISEDEAYKELKSKEFFCNYIFGHDTASGKREMLLEHLQQYKRVECAGKHRNNMPNGEMYGYLEKHGFMRKCKFSIAAESVCYPGFTSEKIGHAFDAYTIPIYFGDPDVAKCFNEKAFVNWHSDESVESVIERVIEIDKNDDLYVEMLCQNRYINANYEEEVLNNFELFLYNIFDQDKDTAYRRPRYYRAGEHESHLKEYSEMQNKFSYRLYKKFSI